LFPLNVKVCVLMHREPSSILILKAHEVSALLKGREDEVIRVVKAAYQAHAAGASSLPQSTFLRFPNDEVNRIIALPAYLGRDFDISGIKWVSSFPGNHELGVDRASAVIIINSTRTGRPTAIFEGATISAKRTAASAALAAKYLNHSEQADAVGVIGCGLISFEVVRFLRATFPGISDLIVFDKRLDQAQRFREKCQKTFDHLKVEIVNDDQQVLRNSSLISVATTAVKPHISDVTRCVRGSTILHVSLRDFSPEVILASDNVVDDIDHVCRANTSVHLAEQAVANRNFIRCPLADIINGKEPARKSGPGLTIFSPFGLGILDIAVSKYVHDLARKSGIGMTVESFFNDGPIR
jgi:N-[(2S)-2-amino-2-carboxyethyl]-L-glutamate dehydrogenase